MLINGSHAYEIHPHIKEEDSAQNFYELILAFR